MPFGPDNLAHDLLRWSHFILDTLVFKVAGQTLRLCGALVLPAFIASQFTRHVVDTGRHFCDHVWDVIRRPYSVKSKQQEFSISFECQTDAVLSYFLVFLDDHTYQTQMDLLEGYEVKSVQLFFLLAYLGGDDTWAMGIHSSKSFNRSVLGFIGWLRCTFLTCLTSLCFLPYSMMWSYILREVMLHTRIWNSC